MLLRQRQPQVRPFATSIRWPHKRPAGVQGGAALGGYPHWPRTVRNHPGSDELGPVKPATAVFVAAAAGAHQSQRRSLGPTPSRGREKYVGPHVCNGDRRPGWVPCRGGGLRHVPPGPEVPPVFVVTMRLWREMAGRSFTKASRPGESPSGGLVCLKRQSRSSVTPSVRLHSLDCPTGVSS